jgi:hypothetical protein
MVLSSIVLVNVVIAVLLDGSLNTMAQEREKISHALAAADDDFTLSRVMSTILDFRSSNNLAEILSNIYDQSDVDGSGSLSFQEAHALRRRTTRRVPTFMSLKIYFYNFSKI